MKTPRQQWLDRVGVEFDPRTHAKLAEDLIAACPPKFTGDLRRFLRDRLAFWKFALPPQDADGPTIMAYNDLEVRCNNDHGTWLAIWLKPDGQYAVEPCHRELTRPTPSRIAQDAQKGRANASEDANRPATPPALSQKLF
jgi:hypothetical protein